MNRENESMKVSQVLVVASKVNEPVFFDCERTGRWRKMRRVAAYVLRFVANLRSKER